MTEKKLIMIYSIHQVLHWMITGIFVPVMALYQLEKGLNLFQIGMSGALYSGITVILELPTGGLADSIGRKKVYILSLYVKGVSIIILCFAQNFTLILLGFLVMGIARALSSGTLDAWFVDEYKKYSPNGNLQKAFATIGIFIPIGLGISSLLGGYLPMSLGRFTETIRGMDKYSGNLLIMLILLFIQMAYTLIFIKEYRKTIRGFSIINECKRLPSALSSSIQCGFKDKVIFLLLLSSVAWGLGFSGLEQFWQPRVKSILGSDEQTWIFGVLTTGYFLAGAFGNLLATGICKLFKENYPRILFISRLLMGTLFIFLAFQQSIIGFSFLYFTLFMINGLSSSPSSYILNEQIEEHNRSTLLSLESLCVQIGGLIGVLMMGIIAQKISIPIAWVVGAAVLCISSMLYLFIPQYKAISKGSSL
jgi:MFS family permease